LKVSLFFGRLDCAVSSIGKPFYFDAELYLDLTIPNVVNGAGLWQIQSLSAYLRTDIML
jgi:hypothetical protein